ncbi:hypothetical protein L1987_30421 [Smallanthus sonchifolius]|uniref:Uncharacterized protein n=1 Tax=Smallanthus sonchifolius TaxID=185202 RepID=A0ACB9I435_9ASTR|nr:hypothetical protein L1987_30421 [Smallanthus sonchifolius]
MGFMREVFCRANGNDGQEDPRADVKEESELARHSLTTRKGKQRRRTLVLTWWNQLITNVSLLLLSLYMVQQLCWELAVELDHLLGSQIQAIQQTVGLLIPGRMVGIQSELIWSLQIPEPFVF